MHLCFRALLTNRRDGNHLSSCCCKVRVDAANAIIQRDRVVSGATAMMDELVDEMFDVICLRCGAPIPVPSSARHSGAGHVTSEHCVPAFIARCECCGKEGCYLASEIVHGAGIPEPVRPAA